MSSNSCNTKLANYGDEWGLLDIRIVLRVSIKLMSFFSLNPLVFLVKSTKHFFVHDNPNTGHISIL